MPTNDHRAAHPRALPGRRRSDSSYDVEASPEVMKGWRACRQRAHTLAGASDGCKADLLKPGPQLVEADESREVLDDVGEDRDIPRSWR